MEFLRSNSVFWSKWGFCYDSPRLYENNKPIVFFENFDKFAGHHKNFADSGVKIHTSILFNEWSGIEKYIAAALIIAKYLRRQDSALCAKAQSMDNCQELFLRP